MSAPAPPTLRPLRRWWVTLLLVIAATLTLALSAAAILCKCYWGYVLSPPGLDPRVLGATKLRGYQSASFPKPGDPIYPGQDFLSLVHFNAFDEFAAIRKPNNAWRLIPPALDADAWRSDWISRGVITDSEFWFGTATPAPPRDWAGLIISTARLESGAYGTGFPGSIAYARILHLSGPTGEPLVLIALHTGELWNDHRAYYELLYDDSVSPPRLLDRRMWYFDVAGYEGAEFASIALAFSVLSIAAVVPPTAVTLLYRRVSRGARIRRGHCPSCDYDLRRDFSAGCSECGWGIGDSRAPERQLQRYSLLGRMIAAATRPPGWRTLLILAVAALLIWYGRSIPSDIPWAMRWGMWLLYAAGAFTLLKAACVWMRPRWCPPRPAGRRLWTRFAAALALGALTIVATQTILPLRVRFMLSRAALERIATANFPNPTVFDATGAGLYIVRGAISAGGDAHGVILLVGESGGSPKRSFVWYPGPRPARATAWGEPIALWDQLAPGWYTWDYMAPPRR